MNSTPEEHWVAADSGIGLHAWVYRPDGIPGGAAPAITMAHGFGGLKDRGLIPFAERFVRAGLVVIVHDHRGFGFSGGWPRGDIDPGSRSTTGAA
jgi:alpha-beta hydrolase superfamily lysophospholipase